MVHLQVMTNLFANLTGNDNLTVANASSLQNFFTETECFMIRFLFVFIGSVGLLENTAVVIIILNNRIMLDYPSNWFVLSLAAADWIFCFAAILLTYALCTGSTSFVIGIVAQFLSVASGGNLLILTFNRFLSVYNSLRYPGLMTCSRAKCLVIIPWAIAFLMSAVIGISVQVGVKNLNYLHASYYALLFLLTNALNAYMFKIAREKRRVTMQQQNAVLAVGKKKLMKNEFRLLIRLFFVTLTFQATCVTTTILLYLYPTLAARQTRSFVEKMIWCLLAILFNAAVDPLIYSTNHPIFRRHLKKLRNRFRRENKKSGTNVVNVVDVDKNRQDIR